MSPDEIPSPPPILRHLARIDELVAAYNARDSGPIYLPKEELSKPTTWEVNLGQRAGTSKADVLAVQMVAALQEIAPDTAYAKGLSTLDLAALASRLKALGDDIRAGHYWPKGGDSDEH